MEVDESEVGAAGTTNQRTRASPEDMIKRYFMMLTTGCGNSQCANKFCVSSSHFFKRAALPPNEAALEAIRLVKEKADVNCGQSQSIPSSQLSTTPQLSSSNSAPSTSRAEPSTSSDILQSSKRHKVLPLSLSLVQETIVRCKQEQKYSEIVKLIGSTFSHIDVLSESYRLDKPCPLTGITLDMQALSKTYDSIFELPDEAFNSALVNAIINLSTDLSIELQYKSRYERDNNIINVILIILELPCLSSPEYIEKAYPAFLQAMTHLPLAGQIALVKVFARLGGDYLKGVLTSLHQLITIRIVSQSDNWSSHHTINNDDHVISAVKIMKLVYFASLLGGRLDESEILSKEKQYRVNLTKSIQDFIQSATESRSTKEKSETKEDPLSLSLEVRSIDCREPLIARQAFVNEMVNDYLEMDKDFTFYRTSPDKFTFIRHSFLLNTPTKSMAMYYDNRIRMISERRSAIISSIIHGGGQPMPYLRLRVRRDHLIDDALVGLEMVFMDNPDDLKKQLYVEFDGEQGIDEGGVSKEFFQLITEEIFNPDFGMFIYNEDTRQFWFNPDSYENDAQFTLVGILLGLAIYNNVILDARFPHVVYRKLMGKLGTLEDMELSHPVLFSSLKQLIEHEGNVEEDMMSTFELSRKSVFGEMISHPLKPGGADMLVNNENRKEFCVLYADYLLNGMVEKQFCAFTRGFHMVTDESPLEMLFSAEEVEVLVCGSSDWDFNALESSTEYDSGFEADSETITHFWQVVHGMNVDEQKKLLQFVSGSDRVPVGGLSKLKLVIARHGPDSDRLPTAHTCFNVLLLPDYKNLEKLKERLLLAITHAKGFGML